MRVVHAIKKAPKKIAPVNLNYTLQQVEKTFMNLTSNIDKGLVKEVKVNALTGAIARKDAAAARKAAGYSKVEAAYKPLEVGVEDGLIKGAVTGAKDITAAGLTPIELTMANPIAVAYSKKHSAELIVEVGGQTKKAVNKIIQESLISDRHPNSSAKLIKNIVGLTERDAGAVAKRYDALWTQGVEQMGFSSAQATKRAEDMSKTYSNKLRKRRSLTIARTETHNAVNEGRKLSWLHNEAEGALAGYKRQWLTAADERVREDHADMNGQTIALGENWQLPNGDEQSFPGEGDINCRCTEILVEDKAAPKKPKPEAAPETTPEAAPETTPETTPEVKPAAKPKPVPKPKPAKIPKPEVLPKPPPSKRMVTPGVKGGTYEKTEVFVTDKMDAKGWELSHVQGYDAEGSSRYLTYKRKNPEEEGVFNIRVSDHVAPEGGGFRTITTGGFTESGRLGDADIHLLITDKKQSPAKTWSDKKTLPQMKKVWEAERRAERAGETSYAPTVTPELKAAWGAGKKAVADARAAGMSIKQTKDARIYMNTVNAYLRK